MLGGREWAWRDIHHLSGSPPPASAAGRGGDCRRAAGARRRRRASHAPEGRGCFPQGNSLLENDIERELRHVRHAAELRAAQAEVATLEMDEGLADEQHADAEQQADDELGQDIGVSPCEWCELARMHPPP